MAKVRKREVRLGGTVFRRADWKAAGGACGGPLTYTIRSTVGESDKRKFEIRVGTPVRPDAQSAVADIYIYIYIYNPPSLKLHYGVGYYLLPSRILSSSLEVASPLSAILRSRTIRC